MVTLFWFTIRQALWQRKILLTLLLLLAPPIIVLLTGSFDNPSPRRQWNQFHEPVTGLLAVILPLVCMLHGTALIGSEIENRTLVYLITRRLRRGTVLLVRFLALATALTLLSAGALLVHYFITGSGASAESLAVGRFGPWDPEYDLWVYVRVVPLAVLGYLSLFTAFGVLFPRPLAASLVYLFVVEVTIGNLPALISTYTLSHKVKLEIARFLPDAVSHMIPRNARELLLPAGAVGWPVLLGVMAVGLVVSYAWVSTRELVPARMARE